MRLFLLFFFILTTFCAPDQVIGQSDIERSYPIDYISKYKDIHVDDNGLGFALGTCGVLVKTENDGGTWETQEAPSDNDYYTVACPPSGCEKALAVGEQGIFRLESGSWTAIEVEELQVDNGSWLFWLSEDVVILDARGDEYYRSDDAGLTWSQIDFETFASTNMYFVDDEIGYVFIDSSLYKTTNAGASFDKTDFTHSSRVFDQTWLNENIGWFFDDQRLFYKTSDGGSTWTLLNEDSPLTSVNWLEALSETHLVGAQITTNRIESLDGGVTWTRTPFLQGGNERVNERYHRRGDAFFTVGDECQIMYSPADFLNFEEQGFTTRIPQPQAIAFSSENIGMAIGPAWSGYTLDGGVTWEQPTGSNAAREVAVLTDGSFVTLSATNTKISRDNGQTFEDWYDASIYFENGQNPTLFTRKPNGDIYLLGSNYSLITTDEGQTFTAINHQSEAAPVAVHFPTDDIGYFVDRQTNLFKSTDGGMSWTATETPYRNLVSLYFLDEDNGLISTASRGYRTRDGGATWETVPNFGGYDITRNPEDNALLAANYLGGNNGAITRSTDNGETWERLNYNCHAYRVGHLVPGGKFYWTSGDGGFIVRHELDAIITSTRDISTEERNSLSVFPNPAQSEIIIDVDTPGISGSLRLLDMTGRVIQQIQDIQQRNILNISHLQNGVYIIQWTDGLKAKETKFVKN